MASCKDCVHVDVCEEYGEVFSLIKGGKCSLFKDHSRFVELPADGVLYGVVDNEIMGLLILIVPAGKGEMFVLSPDSINKTVFLTREEAEQALKGEVK